MYIYFWDLFSMVEWLSFDTTCNKPPIDLLITITIINNYQTFNHLNSFYTNY